MATAGCNVTPTDVTGAPTVIGVLRLYAPGRYDGDWPDTLAAGIEQGLSEAAGGENWAVSWLPGWIDARLLGETELNPAPLIRYWATAADWATARSSFERLTAALAGALVDFAQAANARLSGFGARRR